MGFKTFNVGDVLTAADVNDYLMEQSFIVCTSSTRPGTPNEGMAIYETDTDLARVYDGSTWQPFVRYASGDKFARKTATESVTSSTAMQDDDHLFVSVAANAFYELRAAIFFDGATAADIKMGWTAPASATLDWGIAAPAAGGALFADDQTAYFDLATTPQIGALGSGTTAAAIISGLLATSASGTFRFQWAQFASSATATRVMIRSYISLIRQA